MRRTLTVLAVLLLGLTGTATAEEAHESHHKKNVLAGFVGLTHERRENGLALGVEYERKITESVGVGMLAEYTFGEFDFWVVATPVYFGVDRWRFGIAPGLEGTRGETEPLARLIVGYEFEGKGRHYAPGLSIDFVDGEQVYVLGIAVGFEF
jgi:hypothetical protein